MSFGADDKIGPYRLVGLLGKGGMGEVYQARDPRLERDVAIKVLPAASDADPERLARFEREAKVLAALNHPNISTIYGLETIPGSAGAIVMEFVEGQTLAEQLVRGPATVKEALAIATQIADALDAAHQRGIIHRDLKPANIKITPDGRVKVLDFGIAKLMADAGYGAVDASNLPTMTDAGTRQGILLGTPAYMSPEQTRGPSVDTRTDIWAFGCVLFEMLTGRPAFAAATISDTIAKIIEREPAWRDLPTQTPATVHRLLQRCLEKDPRRRLHHMADIRIELEDALKMFDTRRARDAAGPRARRIPLKGIVAGLTVSAVSVLIVSFLFRGSESHRVASSQDYIPLTNFTDSAVQPSLSPDGRMLTFIRGDQSFLTAGEVYVKLLPNGDPVQLTHDGHDGSKMSPKFSPDGSRITYTKATKGAWETWAVPTLGGGVSQRMLPNAAALTWIDNRRVMFSSLRGIGALMGVTTATENGATARDVYTPAAESGMAHRSYLSPDGKSVLLVEMIVAEGGWQPCRLAPYDGSSKGRQVGPAASQCTEAAWSPNGRWMYFSANTGGGYHLWRQSFPDGPVEQITSGATEEEGIAVIPDGSAIISSVGAHQSSVWIHDRSGERPISAEGYAFVPSFSSDGRKLFYLSRTGSSPVWISGELWSVDLTSGARSRVLPDFLMLHYDISSDGRRIVFAGSDATGKSGVWLASIDGQFPPRLVSAGESQRAFFRQPGDILFQKKEGNSWFVYLADESGTNVRKALTTDVTFLFSVSPDGQWMVVDQAPKLIAYSLSGGSPQPICSPCAETGADQRGHTTAQVSWSPDGKFIYLRGDVAKSNGKIFAIPLRAGQMLPPLPPSGITGPEDVNRLPGVQTIDQVEAFPGPNPSLYAFTKTTTLRNLYQIRIP